MLKVATIASGSSGNCAVVSDGTVHILIDAGISARRITKGLRELGIPPENIAGILLTHEHADHIAGLPVLCRQIGAPIYTAEATARQICRRMAGMEQRFFVFDPGDRFVIQDLTIATFANSHDCACPVGYSVERSGRRMAICTDTGMITPEAREGVRGADLLIGEFNYSVDMLRAGSYPVHLKERILGRRGHLSNEMGGALAGWAVQHGAHKVVLAHLSKENNQVDMALKAAGQAMERIGAKVGQDVELTAAPRSQCSEWLEV